MNELRCCRRYKPGAALVCCVFACVLALGGCTQSFTSAANALNDGISADLDALINLTSESAAELFDSDYTADLLEAGVDVLDIYGPMFSSLTYEVTNISIANNEADVTVTIANKDLTSALQHYTTEITGLLASSESREELASLDNAQLCVLLAQILHECLVADDLAVVEQTLDLHYVKNGSVWQLQENTALISALMGGIDTDLESVFL